MDSVQTLHDFALNLLNDPTALAAFGTRTKPLVGQDYDCRSRARDAICVTSSGVESLASSIPACTPHTSPLGLPTRCR